MRGCLSKGYLKIFFILLSAISVSSYFVNINAKAMDDISDPMLVRAINLSLKEYFPEREETQKILEEDIKNVLKLDARDFEITDISGIEQLTNIQSTIDLSDNNITDIKPLIEWVKNKDNPKLKANIFLGDNPILMKDNYKQIYELSKMSPYIRIYDSQREGEGVIELVGFLNGRPTNDAGFDDVMPNSESDEINQNTSSVVNTGIATIVIYVVACVIIMFLLWSFYRKRNIK